MSTRRPRLPSVTDERKAALFKALAGLYPSPRSELNFTNEYELLVAVLLSAQCTDKKVNEVTPALFARYPSFASLADAEVSEVEQLVRAVNYYRTKAANLVRTAQRVQQDFGGRLPDSHTELTSLPGVGNKTANVVLNERGITPTFPVDTHVFRLAHRLGLSRGRTPLEVEEDLKRHFAPSQWRDLHHQLILHGRRVCRAQRPLCSACALARICPSATTAPFPESSPGIARVKPRKRPSPK